MFGLYRLHYTYLTDIYIFFYSKLKDKRKKEQAENIQRKEDEKVKHKERSLQGMKKTEESKENTEQSKKDDSGSWNFYSHWQLVIRCHYKK